MRTVASAMARVAALLLLCLAPRAAQAQRAQPASLTLTPARVAPGDSALLAWRVPGADSVYVSGLGVVPAAGSRRVSPRQTTTFTLVADRMAVPLQARLEVVGGKGDAFPAEDDPRFGHPVGCGGGDAQRVRVARRVRAALEEGLGMHVREYGLPTGAHVFVTLPVPHGARPAERGIARRRVSHIVTLQPVEARLDCAIRTLVEYQRAGERTWRPERDGAHYTAAALRLRRLVGP